MDILPALLASWSEIFSDPTTLYNCSRAVSESLKVLILPFAIALALAGSRFDEQEKIVTTAALDERLARGCAMGQETTRKQCQLLEPPQQRLTNADWEQLRSHNLSLQSKLDLVTMRMNRCGISNPT